MSMNSSETNERLPAKDFRPWDFGEWSLLCLMVIGAFGNTLSIVIMRSKSLRSSNASLFITLMAMADMILLGLKFAANMLKLYRVPVFNGCVFLQTGAQAASFISVWLVIVTMSERVMAVMRPLQVSSTFTAMRCKGLALGTVLAGLLLGGSTAPCLTFSPTMPYYCQIRGSMDGPCFAFYNSIFPWIRSVMGSWLPSIIICCFSYLTCRSIWMASRKRLRLAVRSPHHPQESFRLSMSFRLPHRGPDSSRPLVAGQSFCEPTSVSRSSRSYLQEKQITVMVTAISISFIVFTFPYALFDLLRKMNVEAELLKSRKFMRFCLLLMDLNHSTNFIFYCLAGDKFRRELVRLFRRKAPKSSLSRNDNPSTLFESIESTFVASNVNTTSALNCSFRK
nr:G protein-coupled receptor [Proales similis]